MAGVGRPTIEERQNPLATKAAVIRAVVEHVTPDDEDSTPNRTMFNHGHLEAIFEHIFDTPAPDAYSTADLRRVLVYNAHRHADTPATGLDRYVQRHQTPSSSIYCTAPHARLIHEYVVDTDDD